MTLSSIALPPPHSGLTLEVSLRRLLKSCEEIAAGDSKGRPDLEDWARSPAFHASVDLLQEQQADLESYSGDRLEPEVLRAYRAHVDALASQLLPVQLPSYCRNPGVAEKSNSHQAAFAARPDTDATQPLHTELRSQEGASLGPSEVRQRKSASVRLNTDAQEKLNRHRNLQDNLTDEMVALAAGLKKNAQAMQQAVNKREGLLDQTDTAVEDSLANAKKSSKESKSLKIRGSITFCAILMAIFFVSFVFVGTYMFIKTTSFMGYRAKPR